MKQWEQWFRVNLDDLMLYARWKTRNEHDAQDVIQWVFETSWNGFRLKLPEDVQALVYHKIRQRAIDLYRSHDSRQRREKKYGAFTVIDSSVQQQEQYHGGLNSCFTEDQEIQQLVIKQLSKLNQQDQEIVTLHIWNKLSYRQIAAVTGISKSTVAARYQSAINQLKDQLQHIEDACNY